MERICSLKVFSFDLWFMKISRPYRNENKILLQSSSSLLPFIYWVLSALSHEKKETIYIPCIRSQPQQSLFPVARPQLDKSWTIKQLSKSWNYTDRTNKVYGPFEPIHNLSLFFLVRGAAGWIFLLFSRSLFMVHYKHISCYKNKYKTLKVNKIKMLFSHQAPE